MASGEKIGSAGVELGTANREGTLDGKFVTDGSCDTNDGSCNTDGNSDGTDVIEGLCDTDGNSDDTDFIEDVSDFEELFEIIGVTDGWVVAVDGLDVKEGRTDGTGVG